MSAEKEGEREEKERGPTNVADAHAKSSLNKVERCQRLPMAMDPVWTDGSDDNHLCGRKEVRQS